MSVHYCGELPGEIHGVADAGVHALPADGTVDVCGVAEDKRTSLSKPIGDPMMHAVCREPIDPLDVETDPFEDALAHVVPRQLAVVVLTVGAYRADETRSPVGLQREDNQEIGGVQRAVQLPVHDRAARLD